MPAVALTPSQTDRSLKEKRTTIPATITATIATAIQNQRSVAQINTACPPRPLLVQSATILGWRAIARSVAVGLAFTLVILLAIAAFLSRPATVIGVDNDALARSLGS